MRLKSTLSSTTLSQRNCYSASPHELLLYLLKQIRHRMSSEFFKKFSFFYMPRFTIPNKLSGTCKYTTIQPARRTPNSVRISAMASGRRFTKYPVYRHPCHRIANTPISISAETQHNQTAAQQDHRHGFRKRDQHGPFRIRSAADRQLG